MACAYAREHVCVCEREREMGGERLLLIIMTFGNIRWSTASQGTKIYSYSEGIFCAKPILLLLCHSIF